MSDTSHLRTFKYKMLGVISGLVFCLTSFTPFVLMPFLDKANILDAFQAAKFLTFVHLMLGLVGALCQKFYFRTRSFVINNDARAVEKSVYVICQGLMASPFMHIPLWLALEAINHFRT